MNGALHLVARVGTERFAFPVAQVDEVIDAPGISWVPGARGGLLGQLDLRDRTLSAYDGAWALGIRRDAAAAANAAGGVGTALVLRDRNERVALVVDDAEDLRMVEPQSVRAVPGGADAEGVLRGVCIASERDRRLVGLVRVSALFARVAAS